MFGIIPSRILATPTPSAPLPRPTFLANKNTTSRIATSHTGPIDFKGVSRQGALKGIRNTHHFQRNLYRQLKTILPGDANYKLREELTKIISENITTSGKLHRDGLRRLLRDKSIGVDRIMTAGQRDRFFRATGLDKPGGSPL